MSSDKILQYAKVRLMRPSRTVVILLAVVAQVACSATGVLCADPSPLRVERTFVPGNRPDAWPPGDWVPIEPEKLDLLLTSAGIASTGSDRFPFSTAFYKATFDPRTQRLESGTAILTCGSRDAGVISFDPCSLAVSEPTWADDGTFSNEERRAILGTSLAGVKRLVTRRNVENLSFKWSLAGRQRLTGIDFDIDVPRAGITGFQVEVPVGWQISSSAGAVTNVSERLNGEDSGSAPAGFTFWRVDLGHLNRCRIRLHEPGTAGPIQHQGVTAFRLNSRFQSSSEWLEQLFDFSFDALPIEVDELTIAIPPELIVSSIENGVGRSYSWRDTGPQPDKWHALRVQIPEAGATDSRRIVIRGNQPVPPPRAAKTVLRLEPPRPSNAVLLGGSFSAVIESPYQIASYSVEGLRQTATSVDEDRHELAFQQYSPQAHLELHIQNADRQSSRKLSVREYALLNVGATPHRLQVVLDLTSQSPGVFATSWRIPLEWELTTVSLAAPSVTPVPGTEALSWSIVRKSAGHQELTIDLADGLPIRKPVRILVTAQRADRSHESEFSVPVILPEISRSVSLAVGIVGIDPLQQTQISTEAYRRHADVESMASREWTTLIASFGDSPQAIWTADFWTLTNDLLTATLSLPRSTPEAGNDDVQLVPIAGAETTKPASSSGSPTSHVDEQKQVGTDPDVEPSNRVNTDYGNDEPVGRSQLMQPVIVSARCESRLSPGNHSRDMNRFTWKFHYSAAPSPFHFQLPAGCELLAVTWRGQPVVPVLENSDWGIPLMFVESGDELSVDYTQPSEDVYLREKYRCHMPTANVTVIQFDWRVRLQNRYSVVSFSPELSASEDELAGFWLSWFFGPLARHNSSPVFNPLENGAWDRFLWGSSRQNAGTGSSIKADWNVFSASASELPESLSIHVCDHARLNSLSWFILTLSVLIGVLLRATAAPHRGQFALLWLSGCIASVTLVPGVYAELIGAAVLGSILAILVPRTLIRAQQTKSGDAGQISMASTITRRIVKGFAFIGWAFLTASAWGQPTATSSETTIPILIRYFDSPFQSRAESDFVLIRSTDLTRLNNSSSLPARSLEDVLLTKTHWSVNVGETGSTEIVASIVAVVHDENARELEIPIPARFLVGQSTCLINGEAANVLPTADGSRLRLPLRPRSTT
ncbi:MAG: hypothetical protein O3B86_05485, partial [Planctomycetota bacterium]|nr:hypothetical protein [Planctomycetota bacterium]